RNPDAGLLIKACVYSACQKKMRFLKAMPKHAQKHRHRHTQTHTDTHRHTQTHTDTHRHTHTQTDTDTDTHSIKMNNAVLLFLRQKQQKKKKMLLFSLTVEMQRCAIIIRPGISSSSKPEEQL